MNISVSAARIVVVPLAVAALAFAAGYALGVSRSGGAPSSTSAASPAKTLDDYAAAVVRGKGTFRDPLERIAYDEKLKSLESALAASGAAGFDACMERLAREKAPEVREAIAAILPRIDERRAAPVLAERLLDPNETEQVRATAAGKLAHLDRAVAVPALLKSLEGISERAWTGSRAVVEALAFLGGPEASAGLLRAFERRSLDLSIRIAAAEALGTLRSADAWDALERCVRFETSDHYSRRTAVRSMLEIDRSRAKALIAEQKAVEQDAGFLQFLEDAERVASLTAPAPKAR